MGEPQSLRFYDFEIFGRAQTTQNQYYSSLETPGHPKQIQIKRGIFINLNLWEIPIFDNFGRGGNRQIMKTC